MVGEPLDDIEVDDFEWDDVNITHLVDRHGTDFNDINEVLDNGLNTSPTCPIALAVT